MSSCNGRNDDPPPDVHAIEEILRHEREWIWITSEPRRGWGLGSCDMQYYDEVCSRVEAVRTVDQLAGVAEDVLR